MSAPAADLAAFRFGFGLPLPEGAAVDADAMLAALAGPDRALHRWPGPDAAAVIALHAACGSARAQTKDTPKGSPERQALQAALQAIEEQQELFLRLIVARALDSPDGLRERLQRFWQDHFTTIPRQPDQRGLTASRGDHAIRPHLAGRFADLLRAAVLHPSMLIALDQTASFGPNSKAGRRRGRGLNENLARELIELHTLGVGARYSQDDVRELARLLTGLSFVVGEGMVFLPNRAEPGAERVLGRSYGGEGIAPVLALLEDLARRPETAAHISRKLCVHFLDDTPDPALVSQMAAVWMATDGALSEVLAVMLNAPAARAPARAKVRQPFDFMIGSLRALGVTGREVMMLNQKDFRRRIRAPMAVMGQHWERPTGPDGWAEEGTAWVTPQGLAARISWSMEVPASFWPRGQAPEAAGFATRALGTLAGPGLAGAVARAETPREAVGLVLASPEFNRR